MSLRKELGMTRRHYWAFRRQLWRMHWWFWRSYEYDGDRDLDNPSARNWHWRSRTVWTRRYDR